MSRRRFTIEIDTDGNVESVQRYLKTVIGSDLIIVHSVQECSVHDIINDVHAIRDRIEGAA
jgi:hypothetical protein